MDWIERLLHLSPDGGNGLTELALVAGASVAVLSLMVRRALRRGRARDKSENQHVGL